MPVWIYPWIPSLNGVVRFEGCSFPNRPGRISTMHVACKEKANIDSADPFYSPHGSFSYWCIFLRLRAENVIKDLSGIGTMVLDCSS